MWRGLPPPPGGAAPARRSGRGAARIRAAPATAPMPVSRGVGRTRPRGRAGAGGAAALSAGASWDVQAADLRPGMRRAAGARPVPGERRLVTVVAGKPAVSGAAVMAISDKNGAAAG